MNEEIMKKSGFGEQVRAVHEGKCPLCKATINEDTFRDELSRREFAISSICQKCQDRIFR